MAAATEGFAGADLAALASGAVHAAVHRAAPALLESLDERIAAVPPPGEASPVLPVPGAAVAAPGQGPRELGEGVETQAGGESGANGVPPFPEVGVGTRDAGDAAGAGMDGVVFGDAAKVGDGDGDAEVCAPGVQPSAAVAEGETTSEVVATPSARAATPTGDTSAAGAPGAQDALPRPSPDAALKILDAVKVHYPTISAPA